MGLARSTYYDAPRRAADDTALVEAMAAICDAFEAYGWRRVQAALRQQGWRVNHDVAVMGGFVYVAIILDAWSRRVVGYALGRSVDRCPPDPRGSERGDRAASAGTGTDPPHGPRQSTQYAGEAYRKVLVKHGIVGSMGGRGNPYNCEGEAE